MKTILVPTDFSRNADKALEYAVSIAKKSKGNILLLHVYSMLYISSDVPIDIAAEELYAIEAAAEKALNKRCEKVKLKNKVKCSAVSRQGVVIDTILDTIKSKKVDFVVMGTKGASGMKEAFVGTNTSKLISKTKVPVIAVPKKTTLRGIKNIVYATDFHSSDIASLKQLAEIARLFKSHVTVVHVADSEYTLEAEKMNLAKFMSKVRKNVDYKHVAHELLYAYDAEKKLEQYMRKHPVELFAVSTRYRNFVERILGSSVTKKLVYHTKVPLLAFHHK